MRNLLEYPITRDEVIECLTKLRESILEEGCIGDMRPLLLTVAIKEMEL